jgi:hypothetical protein
MILCIGGKSVEALMSWTFLSAGPEVVQRLWPVNAG